MPKILKNIYIQISRTPKNPIDVILEKFNYNKDIFKVIHFEYIYLPIIDQHGLENCKKDLLKNDLYKTNFKNILAKITEIRKYNAVSSLINYVDEFNETINGNSGFYSQTIIKDIELDFIGVYSRYEQKLKNELSKKIPELIKVENLHETFDNFIKKQKNLKFTFNIIDNDFTFYGSCEEFNKLYKDLKKKYSFKIKPE